MYDCHSRELAERERERELERVNVLRVIHRVRSVCSKP